MKALATPVQSSGAAALDVGHRSGPVAHPLQEFEEPKSQPGASIPSSTVAAPSASKVWVIALVVSCNRFTAERRVSRRCFEEAEWQAV